MIDLAYGICGFLVKPEGSKRMWENLSTKNWSGTPYWSANEIAVKRVHQARDGGALLGHGDEDFARGAVLVHADGDVAFVAGDIEFVGDRFALVGQLAPLHAIVGGRDRRDRVRRFLHLLPAGVERLRALGSVAVNGDRLEAELPGGEVSLGNFVHGRFGGHVDGLGNRAGDERLHRTHHLEVPVVVNRARAGARLEG